jgi:hypothetical protein
LSVSLIQTVTVNFGPHLLWQRCCRVVRQRLRPVLATDGCELGLNEQAGAGDAVHLQVQQACSNAHRSVKHTGILCTYRCSEHAVTHTVVPSTPGNLLSVAPAAGTQFCPSCSACAVRHYPCGCQAPFSAGPDLAPFGHVSAASAALCLQSRRMRPFTYSMWLCLSGCQAVLVPLET